MVGEASTLRDLARANPEDVSRWQTALAAAKQAEGVAVGDAEALRQLAVLQVEVQAGAEAADRDRALLDKLVDIRSAEADDPDGDATDAGYAGAFREAGLDPAALAPAEAAARIKARPPGVALAISAALDDWSAVRWGLRNDPAGAGRLAEVARLADLDPWRNDLRAALAPAAKDGRKGALRALAGTAKFDELGAVSLDLLGRALAVGATRRRPRRSCAGPRSATRQTSGSTTTWPGSWTGSTAATRPSASTPPPASSAPRPPTSWPTLLADKGEFDEAIEVFRDLARLRPKMGRHFNCLGRS